MVRTPIGCKIGRVGLEVRQVGIFGEQLALIRAAGLWRGAAGGRGRIVPAVERHLGPIGPPLGRGVGRRTVDIEIVQAGGTERLAAGIEGDRTGGDGVALHDATVPLVIVARYAGGVAGPREGLVGRGRMGDCLVVGFPVRGRRVQVLPHASAVAAVVLAINAVPVPGTIVVAAIRRVVAALALIVNFVGCGRRDLLPFARLVGHAVGNIVLWQQGTDIDRAGIGHEGIPDPRTAVRGSRLERRVEPVHRGLECAHP